MDIARYHRAIQQNLYLTEFIEESMEFIVCGTKKNNYNIQFYEKGDCKCNCLDYKFRQKACKHIIFIIAKYGKVDFKELKEILEMKIFPFQKIWIKIKHEMKNRINGNGSDCSICLDEMLMENPAIKCSTCNNLFHVFCIQNWLCNGNNKKCPLCRSRI